MSTTTDVPHPLPEPLAEAIAERFLIDWERGHPREDGPPEDVLLTAGEAIHELAAAGLKAHQVDAPFADRYT